MHAERLFKLLRARHDDRQYRQNAHKCGPQQGRADDIACAGGVFVAAIDVGPLDVNPALEIVLAAGQIAGLLSIPEFPFCRSAGYVVSLLP